MIPLAEWDIFDAMNVLIVLVGLVMIYCSFRLASVMKQITPSIWWTICPMLVCWGVLNRFLVVVYSGTPYLEDVVSLNLLWWIGVTIFTRQVRISAETLVLPLVRKEKKP